MDDEFIIRERMRVYSRDGYFLGRVIAVGDADFEIERGVLLPHDFIVDREHVAYATVHELVLDLSHDELIEFHADAGSAVAPREGSDTSESLNSEQPGAY